jgi:hypothetical protein
VFGVFLREETLTLVGVTAHQDQSCCCLGSAFELAAFQTVGLHRGLGAHRYHRLVASVSTPCVGSEPLSWLQNS